METNTETKTVAVDIQIMLKELGTKSAVIRHLAANGWKRGAIAKELGIRYQHVRNVLTAPLPKRKELL